MHVCEIFYFDKKKKVSVNKRIQRTLYQMMLDFLIFINYTVLIYKISFSIKLLILSLLSVIFGHVKTIVQYMYCYWGTNWSGLKNYRTLIVRICVNWSTDTFLCSNFRIQIWLKPNNLNRKISQLFSFQEYRFAQKTWLIM